MVQQQCQTKSLKLQKNGKPVATALATLNSFSRNVLTAVIVVHCVAEWVWDTITTSRIAEVAQIVVAVTCN